MRKNRRMSLKRATSVQNQSPEPSKAKEDGSKARPGADNAAKQVILIEDDDVDVIPDTQPVDDRILKDVVAYVEVRTKTDNRSKGVSKQLELLGATVSKKFSNDVTHVIWKDGKKSTIDRAVKKGMSVVSVLWIESCKQNQEHIAESLFPVAVPDDNDLLQIGRLKRMKSMQPKPVEEDLQRSLDLGVRKRRRHGVLESPAPLTVSPACTEPMTPTTSDGPTTPSLIPDTPSHMKACLDLLDSIKKNKGSAQRRLSSVDSPKISPSTPLQQRLFQYFTEEVKSPGGTPSMIHQSPTDTPSTSISMQDSPKDSPSASVRLHKSGPTRRAGCSKRRLDESSSDSLTDTVTAKRGRGRISKGTPKSHTQSDKKDDDGGLEKGLLLPGKKILQSPSALRDKNPAKKGRGRTSKGADKDGEEDEGTKAIQTLPGNKVMQSISNEDGEKPSSKGRKQSSKGTSKNRSLVHSSLEGVSSEEGRSSTVDSLSSRSMSSTEGKTSDKKRISEDTMPVKKCRKSCRSLELSATNSDVPSTQHKDRPSVEGNGLEKVALEESSRADGTEDQKSKKKQKLPVSRTKKFSHEGCDQKQEKSFEFKQNKNMMAAETSGPNLSKQGKKKEKESASLNEHLGEGLSETNEQLSSLMSHLTCPSILSTSSSQNRPSIDEFKPSGESLTTRKSSLKTSSGTKKRKKESSSASSEEEKTSVPSLVSLECDQAKGDEKENDTSKLKNEKTKKRKKVTMADDTWIKKQKKPTIVMTSLHRSDQEIVISVVNNLGGFIITDTVGESTTHVVIGENRRTLNVLSGIARGCWLLSMDWVYKSVEAGCWMSEEPYEMSDHFPGAMVSRLEHQQHAGADQSEAQIAIFSSCGTLYIPAESSPPRERLVELVELCGGQVSKRVTEAKLCIGSAGRRKNGSIPVVAEKWILDSITRFKQLPWKPYAVV